MKKSDNDLRRLFRSAATDMGVSAQEAPFGFETRVVALWRAANGERAEVSDVTRFVRRIGALALAVLLVTSAGAYWQYSDDELQNSSGANEYAIADSAIETVISR